jgi:hypothetical protein
LGDQPLRDLLRFKLKHYRFLNSLGARQPSAYLRIGVKGAVGLRSDDAEPFEDDHHCGYPQQLFDRPPSAKA